MSQYDFSSLPDKPDQQPQPNEISISVGSEPQKYDFSTLPDQPKKPTQAEVIAKHKAELAKPLSVPTTPWDQFTHDFFDPKHNWESLKTSGTSLAGLVHGAVVDLPGALYESAKTLRDLVNPFTNYETTGRIIHDVKNLPAQIKESALKSGSEPYQFGRTMGQVGVQPAVTGGILRNAPRVPLSSVVGRPIQAAGWATRHGAFTGFAPNAIVPRHLWRLERAVGRGIENAGEWVANTSVRVPRIPTPVVQGTQVLATIPEQNKQEPVVNEPIQGTEAAQGYDFSTLPDQPEPPFESGFNEALNEPQFPELQNYETGFPESELDPRQRESLEHLQGNVLTGQSAPPTDADWWIDKGLRVAPSIAGYALGGWPGGMIGGGIGNYAAQAYSGKELNPWETGVAALTGAIPPIFGPARYGGPGLSAIARQAARSAGSGAVEGGLISGAATPFQHWAQTGSFDAPISAYMENIGGGGIVGGLTGGLVGGYQGWRGVGRPGRPEVLGAEPGFTPRPGFGAGGPPRTPPPPNRGSGGSPGPTMTINAPRLTGQVDPIVTDPVNPNLKTVNITEPNVVPPGSEVASNGLTVTIRDVQDIAHWEGKGFTLVPGLNASDGNPIMVRNDVVHMYGVKPNRSAAPPTQPIAPVQEPTIAPQTQTPESLLAPLPEGRVSSPFEKSMRAAVAAQRAEGLTGEGIVSIPNEQVTPTVVARLEGKYEFIKQGPTHTFFRKIAEDEVSGEDFGAIIPPSSSGVQGPSFAPPESGGGGRWGGRESGRYRLGKAPDGEWIVVDSHTGQIIHNTNDPVEARMFADNYNANVLDTPNRLSTTPLPPTTRAAAMFDANNAFDEAVALLNNGTVGSVDDAHKLIHDTADRLNRAGYANQAEKLINDWNEHVDNFFNGSPATPPRSEGPVQDLNLDPEDLADINRITDINAARHFRDVWEGQVFSASAEGDTETAEYFNRMLSALYKKIEQLEAGTPPQARDVDPNRMMGADLSGLPPQISGIMDEMLASLRGADRATLTENREAILNGMEALERLRGSDAEKRAYRQMFDILDDMLHRLSQGREIDMDRYDVSPPPQNTGDPSRFQEDDWEESSGLDIPRGPADDIVELPTGMFGVKDKSGDILFRLNTREEAEKYVHAMKLPSNELLQFWKHFSEEGGHQNLVDEITKVLRSRGIEPSTADIPPFHLRPLYSGWDWNDTPASDIPPAASTELREQTQLDKIGDAGKTPAELGTWQPDPNPYLPGGKLRPGWPQQPLNAPDEGGPFDQTGKVAPFPFGGKTPTNLFELTQQIKQVLKTGYDESTIDSLMQRAKELIQNPTIVRIHPNEDLDQLSSNQMLDRQISSTQTNFSEIEHLAKTATDEDAGELFHQLANDLLDKLNELRVARREGNKPLGALKKDPRTGAMVPAAFPNIPPENSYVWMNGKLVPRSELGPREVSPSEIDVSPPHAGEPYTPPGSITKEMEARATLNAIIKAKGILPKNVTPEMRDVLDQAKNVTPGAQKQLTDKEGKVIPFSDPLGRDLGKTLSQLTDEDIRNLDSVDDFGRPLSRADRGLPEYPENRLEKISQASEGGPTPPVGPYHPEYKELWQEFYETEARTQVNVRDAEESVRDWQDKVQKLITAGASPEMIKNAKNVLKIAEARLTELSGGRNTDILGAGIGGDDDLIRSAAWSDARSGTQPELGLERPPDQPPPQFDLPPQTPDVPRVGQDPLETNQRGLNLQTPGKWKKTGYTFADWKQLMTELGNREGGSLTHDWARDQLAVLTQQGSPGLRLNERRGYGTSGPPLGYDPIFRDSTGKPIIHAKISMQRDGRPKIGTLVADVTNPETTNAMMEFMMEIRKIGLPKFDSSISKHTVNLIYRMGDFLDDAAPAGLKRRTFRSVRNPVTGQLEEKMTGRDDPNPFVTPGSALADPNAVVNALYSGGGSLPDIIGEYIRNSGIAPEIYQAIGEGYGVLPANYTGVLSRLPVVRTLSDGSTAVELGAVSQETFIDRVAEFLLQNAPSGGTTPTTTPPAAPAPARSGINTPEALAAIIEGYIVLPHDSVLLGHERLVRRLSDGSQVVDYRTHAGTSYTTPTQGQTPSPANPFPTVMTPSQVSSAPALETRIDVFDPSVGVTIQTFDSQAEADAFMASHPAGQTLDSSPHDPNALTMGGQQTLRNVQNAPLVPSTPPSTTPTPVSTGPLRSEEEVRRFYPTETDPEVLQARRERLLLFPPGSDLDPYETLIRVLSDGWMAVRPARLNPDNPNRSRW